MLAKLSATATSSSTAVSAWIEPTNLPIHRLRRTVALLPDSIASLLTSLCALGGSDELVPQRLELRLGLDDVVADRRCFRHQLGVIGGGELEHLAALFRPGLALLRQKIERPGKDLR